MFKSLKGITRRDWFVAMILPEIVRQNPNREVKHNASQAVIYAELIIKAIDNLDKDK